MTYRDFRKHFIGKSHYAVLAMMGRRDEQGIVCEKLEFGLEGEYTAYVADFEVEIPEHYSKVAEFTGWLKIYDDEELVGFFSANKITVYRAGKMGCIITTLD